jgi:hypothetical protein
MRLPKNAVNPSLAVLIQGAGFASLERFAAAVNECAWRLHGLKLSYDHISVKRWISGSACQYPDVVAAVISRAWGVTIPVAVIWPGRRDGDLPVPAHLQAWVAPRTLEDLGVFLRSDMLTRREMLASSIGVATGAALADPIARWLGMESAGLGLPQRAEAGRIGTSEVAAIEAATRHFGSIDADAGGGLSREAAVGQLKYAVDLAQHATYTEVVGERLLAAIANLSGLVGWMSFDANMNGPAQRYFVYGLQAAHEVGDDSTRLRAAGILADMAHQMRALGQPQTGLRLIELALEQVPQDRRRFNAVRAMLWNLKANMLAAMGMGYRSEVRNAINLSFDLYADAQDDEPSPAVAEYWPYTSDAELAGVAAMSYRDLAATENEPNLDLAHEAERQALSALTRRADGFARSRVFDRILLARARLLKGEPEQACQDGHLAIDTAAEVPASKRVVTRLRDLITETEPFKGTPAVRDLRERLALVTGR